MRVLIATWVFPTHGGVYTFLHKLIPSLQEKGHEFHVVSVEPSREASRPFPALDPERIVHVRQLPLPRPFGFPIASLILTTLRICRDRGIETIFCQDPIFSGIPSLISARLLNTRLIVADHGLVTNVSREEYWHNFSLPAAFLWRRLALLVMRRILHDSDPIYSPGWDITQRMTELFGEDLQRVITIPIGVDAQVYSPDPSARTRVRREMGIGDELVITFVGRLHVESGLDYLIEAAKTIGTRPGIRYLIVGDGNLREAYERSAEETSPGMFLFVGYSDRVDQILKASDIFAFPKIFAGGFSVALREAMATGLPVVATSGVDSHDAIVDSGQDGVLVPPKNGEELAAALSALITDPEARHRLGTKARNKIISKFGMDSFGEGLASMIAP